MKKLIIVVVYTSLFLISCADYCTKKDCEGKMCQKTQCFCMPCEKEIVIDYQ